MPRADLLLALVRASSNGDAATFRRALEAMIADEQAKQHHVLAERLSETLTIPFRGQRDAPAAPNGLGLAGGGSQYLMELTPRIRLDDLFLPPSTRRAVLELVEEQQRQDLLRAHGLEPRHRLLLSGPPGNGKTSLAEALADALALEFLVVRYEAVIGSYLGETAIRLDRVFEAARLRHCVLFLDEFDTLGKERGDPHDTGEIKRVVSSLLLQIDALPAYVVVVAATNHPELLDRAVWRRFDLRLDLNPPDSGLLGQWTDRLEERLGQPLGATRARVTRALAGRSYSTLEAFALDILRRRALAPNEPINRIVSDRLQKLKEDAV